MPIRSPPGRAPPLPRSPPRPNANADGLLSCSWSASWFSLERRRYQAILVLARTRWPPQFPHRYSLNDRPLLTLPTASMSSEAGPRLLRAPPDQALPFPVRDWPNPRPCLPRVWGPTCYRRRAARRSMGCRRRRRGGSGRTRFRSAALQSPREWPGGGGGLLATAGGPALATRAQADPPTERARME
jgi:hypothetical protein